MPRLAQLPALRTPLTGVFAGLLVLVVLALTFASVSPGTHAWLHGDHDCAASHESAPASDHDDAGCPVVLFAGGLTVPLELPVLAAPCRVEAAFAFPAPTEPDFRSPRYLHRPERGPPARG